jgi:hypothetical protein
MLRRPHAETADRVLAAVPPVFIALQADHGSHGPAVACALLATGLR